MKMGNSKIIIFLATALSGIIILNPGTLLADTSYASKHSDIEIGVAHIVPKKYYRRRHEKTEKVLQQTIENRLENSNLFSVVKSSNTANHVLQTDIIFQASGIFSGVHKGTRHVINVKYSIKNNDSGNILYENQFTSACFKTLGDAFSGRKRFKITVSCSVNDNVDQFIEDFGKRGLRAQPANPPE